MIIVALAVAGKTMVAASREVGRGERGLPRVVPSFLFGLC